jgi:hypothetical protein
VTGLPIPRTPPVDPERPGDDDLRLLELLATGRGAAAASERSGRSLSTIACRLADLRGHYRVASTRAAIDRARRAGHFTS